MKKATVVLTLFFLMSIVVHAELIGYWTFDEISGTTAADSSGKGSDATWQTTDGLTWQTGIIGGCARLEGTPHTDQKFEFDLTGLDSSATGLTICGWIQPESQASHWDKYKGVIMTRAVSDKNGAGIGQNYGFAFEAYDHIDYRLSGESVDSSDESIVEGTGLWYHIACVYDGTSFAGYINGQKVASRDDLSGILPIVSGGVWCFGNDPSQKYRNFRGSLDDFAVWNQPLTDADIDLIYQQGLVGAGVLKGAAHVQIPGGLKVDSTQVSSVSWYSPNQDFNGNSDPDPNIVSIDNYDVYFYGYSNAAISADPNLADPNFNGLDPVQTSTDQSKSVSLEYEHTYFWRVDTHVTWDTDEITGSITSIVEGFPWQFTTRPEYIEPVLSFDNVITALEFMPDTISAVVKDNTNPITIVEFTLLVDDYEFPAGANASLTNDTTNNQTPEATLTTDTPGLYKIQLLISDGMMSEPAVKMIEVEVYADACQAKKGAGDWTANHYDRDDNCIVDLNDFVEFAKEWLDYTGLVTQELYTGDVTFISKAVFDARIEAESVDPAAVSDAPVTDTTGVRIVNEPGATGGGQALGYTDSGTYAEFEVTVLKAGKYDLHISTAGPNSQATLSFGDGTTDDLYGSVGPFPAGSWGKYHISVYEEALTFDAGGTHTVRITWPGEAVNLDWFSIVE